MEQPLIRQILRGVWVAVVAAAVLLALYFILPLVLPFVFALVIAYMMNPLVRALEKIRFPRWLAVLVSLLVFIGAAAGLITLITTNLIFELGSLVNYVQNNLERWKNELIAFIYSDSVQNIIEQLTAFYEDNPQYHNTINSNLASAAKTLTDYSSMLVASLLDLTVRFAASLPSVLTLTVIAILAAFFISKNWRKYGTFISGIVSSNVLTYTRIVWNDLQSALFGYLRAQLILISVTTVVIISGLLIIGVDYAFALGLLVGLADLMPYLGPGAVMVPWIIYEFFNGDIYTGVGLSILYGIILVARQILEPKVLATSIGLDPLVTLISLFVGLKLFGVLGLIIGPVTVVVTMAVHRAGVFRDIYRYVVTGKGGHDGPGGGPGGGGPAGGGPASDGPAGGGPISGGLVGGNAAGGSVATSGIAGGSAAGEITTGGEIARGFPRDGGPGPGRGASDGEKSVGGSAAERRAAGPAASGDSDRSTDRPDGPGGRNGTPAGVSVRIWGKNLFSR